MPGGSGLPSPDQNVHECNQFGGVSTSHGFGCWWLKMQKYLGTPGEPAFEGAISNLQTNQLNFIL